MRIGAPGLASETAVTARRTQRRLCNLLREKKPQGFKFRGKCQLVPRRLFSVANCPPLTSFRGVHLLASSNCSSRLDHHESQGQTCTPCTFQHIQFLSGDSSLLDKLSSNKLTISSHDEILMELRLDLKRLEHSPEGRAVLLARRQADAAALQEDVRLRYAGALKKLERVRTDRAQKVDSLSAIGDVTPLQRSNICTFSLRGRRVEVAQDLWIRKIRLRKKLQKNKSVIQEAMEEMQDILQSRAYAQWRLMERVYEQRLRASGIDEIRQRIRDTTREKGQMANRLGEQFEDACADVVWGRLLPSVLEELGECVLPSRKQGALSSNPTIMVLSNLCFRCPMPPKATGEFDFMIVRAECPTETFGPDGRREIWSAEVLKVVECKSSPRAVPRDICAMARALAYLSGEPLPEPCEGLGPCGPFKEFTTKAADGRWLRFTPESFSRFRSGPAAAKAKHLVYITSGLRRGSADGRGQHDGQAWPLANAAADGCAGAEGTDRARGGRSAGEGGESGSWRLDEEEGAGPEFLPKLSQTSYPRALLHGVVSQGNFWVLQPAANG